VLRVLLSTALLFLLTSAIPSQAEEREQSNDAGRLGLLATVHGLLYGSDVGLGVTYHVSRRLAFRPSVSFGHKEDDTSADTTYEPSSSYVGPSSVLSSSSSSFTQKLGLLYYLGTNPKTSPYLGVAYSHSSSSSRSESLTDTTAFEGTRVFRYVSLADDRRRIGSAFVGVEHSFGKRFRAFGELGVSFGSVRSGSSSESSSRLLVPNGAVFVEEPGTITSASRSRGNVSGSFDSFAGLVVLLN
jgi:hypothetical protein